MDCNKKTVVIIAAAGVGRRMGSGIPKQYLNIDGEPMLVKTLRAFCQSEAVDGIFIVTNSEYIHWCQALKQQYGMEKILSVVEGGRERQDSVFCALQEIERKSPDAGWVLIHDAARPFVSQEIIENTIAEMKDTGAAIVCVPVKDSIRQVLEKENDHRTDCFSRNLPRETLFAVQTPQGFRLDWIREAYERAFADGFYGTDDAGLVERLHYPVRMVTGEYSNLKVTTKEDLPVESRIGTGYDVHRLVEGRKLILGGVEIPFERGLLGHSDADVLIHAAIDAVLGAASMGDIGLHFPDTQEQYRGISSITLLERVQKKITEAGYRIGNLDITVIAQKPKIRPYIKQMVQNMAKALDTEEGRINIKGTTTEKLGFEGREEGIAAQAVCLLNR